MAGRKVSAIRIRDLRYAEVLSAKPTYADVATSFKAAAKIENSHQDTFTYEEDEPTVTGYKNDLTGKTYRSDVEAGEKRINFTIGQYDFDLKAALQGGTSGDSGKSYESGDSTELRYKAFYALTQDNVLIVFPRANIVASNSSTDNAIGIAVSAIPEEVSGVTKDEYWFDAEELDLYGE
jgi:hypothetical protein